MGIDSHGNNGHSHSHTGCFPFLPIPIPNFVTNSHYHGNPMGFPFQLGIPLPWSSLFETQKEFISSSFIFSLCIVVWPWPWHCGLGLDCSGLALQRRRWQVVPDSETTRLRTRSCLFETRTTAEGLNGGGRVLRRRLRSAKQLCA